MDGMFLCQRHWEADKERVRQDPKVTAANIRECNARCERERYARLQAAGLCVTCGKRPNYEGCKRCVECQEKRRAYHHAYRGKKRGGVHAWKIANHMMFETRKKSA